MPGRISTVFRICITEDHYLSVVPADELYDTLRSAKEKKDLAEKTASVAARVLGVPAPEKAGKPKREYLLR